MLENDPKPGTRIRFRDVKKTAGQRFGRLAKRGGYPVDKPGDTFEIDLPDGRKVIVRRDEIEQAD